MTKYLNIFTIILLIAACSTSQEQQKDSKIPSSTDILKKSQQVHDPNQNWSTSSLHLHIQEPRLGNPERYSKIKLHNKDNTFELLRNRDTHVSKHTVDKNGNTKVYLNDSETIPTDLIEAHRLTPERSKIYQEFYAMMYGLPMTLDSNTIAAFGNPESAVYNQQNCYKIPIILKEPMFSKNWNVYIHTDSYEFKGMEIVFPDEKDKGERLFFSGTININDMKLPRIRHWYEYANDTYLGSDIIIKTL